MPSALVIEDDRSSLAALIELVEGEGFTARGADGVHAARRAINQNPPDLVLTDLMLPDGSGLDLVEEAAEVGAQVVLITGHASVETAVDALRRGATDYLTKPVDLPRLKAILANVARTRELQAEIGSLRGELRKLGRFGPLVGASASMGAVYDLIGRVSPTDATVFIVGESGTGKEVVAQTVHELSRRRKEVFVPVNCGAVSPTLIESTLFGHEKGSFTGAERTHRGVFEQAQGVDVRVIAATNRVPEQAVQEGKLREDLWYRLNVFPIGLPPLRERVGDIDVLAEHFLAELNTAGQTHKRWGVRAQAALQRYRWPGNVRELKNLAHRAYILAEEEIGSECLPAEVVGGGGGGGAVAEPLRAMGTTELGGALTVQVGSTVAEAEQRLILATLEACGGNKQRAAEVLGVSLKTIYNRLNAYRESRAA